MGGILKTSLDDLSMKVMSREVQENPIPLPSEGRGCWFDPSRARHLALGVSP